MLDDNLKNLSATKGFLEINGYEVETTSVIDKALELVRENEYALLLLDFQMPEMNGDLVALRIHEISPLQQIAMFSSDQSRDAIKRSHKAGAVEFIDKNGDPDELLSTIATYCARYDKICKTIRPLNDKNENAALLGSLKMVGRSEIMAEVAAKIRKLGEASDISVFISGESGTGKELVAKALHNTSSRGKKPFIAINCSAIPAQLLESELFGHAKGAFTGAVDHKVGLFVQAQGGTIFLDEVSEMPIELQAKLLRVLQERVVTPVGAKSPIKLDVRILSASHRDLEAQVAAGKFREDLMYRIKVSDIYLPPLRERKEDIEPLIGFFTEYFSKNVSLRKRFLSATLDVLKQYSWPGNVRELSNFVERSLIECSGNAIRVEDLDRRLFAKVDQVADTSTSDLESFDQKQRAAKFEFIQKVIDESDSKAEAARSLGVSPTNLQYLLKSLAPSNFKSRDAKSAASDSKIE
jgi:DNA-binding NtrC family response regulator